MNINGYALLSDALLEVPRFQLSAAVPVTPEFRAWFNEWARDFFGVDDDKFYVSHALRAVVVSPRLFAQMRDMPGLDDPQAPTSPDGRRDVSPFKFDALRGPAIAPPGHCVINLQVPA